MESNKEGTNLMWKVIKNHVLRKEISPPVHSKDMTKLANEFNEFFTSVGAAPSEESRKLAV